MAERFHNFYKDMAIPASSFDRAVIFAMEQPADINININININEILFRPPRQEL